MLYFAHYLSARDNQKSKLVTLRVIGFVDDYTLGDRETGSNCLRHHPNQRKDDDVAAFSQTLHVRFPPDQVQRAVDPPLTDERFEFAAHDRDCR